MIRILVVEDERSISDFICRGLAGEAYQTACAYDGLSAANMIDHSRYDLILLDVMLPGVDGFELMRYIAPLQIPVIFITAKGAVTDRVAGLRLGADDYIVKPFEIIELRARIDAVMKRYGKGSSELALNDVLVNTRTRTVTKAGMPVELKAREFDLLVFLMRNRDMALFRETIYEHVWEREYLGDTRTVDLHILRLRKKLGWEKQLVTLNRIGYRLNSKT
ncbi:MAG: response regulator transcription factor [Clostridia bacterium]|nr:response regulator transcription factor [Clostridia bacterium]